MDDFNRQRGEDFSRGRARDWNERENERRFGGREEFPRRDYDERSVRSEGESGRYGSQGPGRGGYSSGPRGTWGGASGSYGGYSQGGYGQTGYGSEGEWNPSQDYGSGSFGSRGSWSPSESQRYGAQGSFGSDVSGSTGPDRYARSGSTGYGSAAARGRFVGRGPKGYTRSDERIKEDVSDRLEQHADIDASEIEVKVEMGEITLEGKVDDRETKRLAEDVAEGCAGVKQVHNRLRVDRGFFEKLFGSSKEEDDRSERDKSVGRGKTGTL